MRKVELREFALDKYHIVEEDEPKPGPGQVIVRVRAASLNYRDLMIAKGQYNPRMKLPAVPLSDCAGQIAATGEGVDRVRKGDKVCIAFMPEWIDGQVNEAKAKSALGAGGIGVAAEYVAIDANAVVPFPDHLSFEEATTLPCAGVTAWNALITTGHLRPEETILVLGTGGVSVFAVQFAMLMGARVIATSSSDEKLDRVRKLGAEGTINYRTEPDWDKRARELAEPLGIDHIIEVGGVQTLPRSIKAVRMGGRISLIGVLSGAGEVNFTPIFMRNLNLQGIFVGSREMFEDMNRAITMHKLHPVVDRIFPLAQLTEALRFMESGAHFGKICLTWN